MSAVMRHPFDWARDYTQRGPRTATYSMKHLAGQGVLPAARTFLLDNGLIDMVWEMTWAGPDDTPDDQLEERLADADGYVIFVHGWTGNHKVWEALPEMIVTANPRLIAIAIDHNGFGEAAFARDPAIDECNPPAAMHRLEHWVDVLKLRRQPGETQRKTINFVGHSMGGATLFYSDPARWHYGEQTCYALAPALLLEDEMKQIFYQALGLGISLVNRIHAFEIIEHAIKPQIINQLCTQASPNVHRLHTAQYQQTARGTTAATFTAMGVLRDRKISHNFDLFRVMLGHRDPLVGLVPMIDLLCDLQFPPAQMRVVAGSHYMFSLGEESVKQHTQNRDLIVQDILALHTHALTMQEQGQRIG